VLPLTTAVNCLTTSPGAPFGALGSFPSKEIERGPWQCPQQHARGLSFTTVAVNIAKLPQMLRQNTSLANRTRTTG
jgi:hypothetical protein